jgi:hypothetical protein
MELGRTHEGTIVHYKFHNRSREDMERTEKKEGIIHRKKWHFIRSQNTCEKRAKEGFLIGI